MKITPILIGILLFSGLMCAFGWFYLDSYSRYYGSSSNNTTSYESFESFNSSFNSMNESMSNIYSKVTTTNKGLYNPLGIVVDSLLMFVDALGLIAQAPNILLTFLTQITTLVPSLPPWLLPMIGAIVTVVVVMRIAALVLKTDEE